MKIEKYIFSILMIGLWMLLGSGCVTLSNAKEDKIALQVARIAYVEGAVTMQRLTDEDWTEATINTPLMAGDKLYTGIGGRAEIQLDDEVVIRLSEDTYIDLPILDDALVFIFLSGFSGWLALCPSCSIRRPQHRVSISLVSA